MNVRRALPVSLIFSLLLAAQLGAEPIPVHFTQGQGRGFVVVRSAAGAIIGNGEYSQEAIGDRVTSRLTLRLRGGSLDDETTVYSQHGAYALISDHHIQRGPFFSDPSDSTISADGAVSIRTIGRDGKEKIVTSHLDMPADVSNGLVSTLLTNIPADKPEFRLGMFVPSGKGRLVQLRVTPEDKSYFSMIGVRHTVGVFRLHPELGGVAGVVAPIIGKQPADALVYVLEGDCPTVVREVGQLAEGGPIVSIELAGGSFPSVVLPAKAVPARTAAAK